MPNHRGQFGYAQALQAARYLKKRSPGFPRVGIVLGSGLDSLAARLNNPTIIPYELIPHFPRPAVEGHAGKLHLGSWKKLPVAVLAGRVHLYEGYSPAEVAFATRALGLAGVETLILTCAAGGIAPAAVLGPQYETPAEIRALKKLGADAVGMSAVPEAIAARQMNLQVLAIALITNHAAGIAPKPLRHDNVLATGSRAAQNLARLLDHVLPALAG